MRKRPTCKESRQVVPVLPFRASKISRSAQRKSRDSQPPKTGYDLLAASLIHPQTVNESFPHSQLVAKTVSPRRPFLFTSENNANICNHVRHICRKASQFVGKCLASLLCGCVTYPFRKNEKNVNKRGAQVSSGIAVSPR